MMLKHKVDALPVVGDPDSERTPVGIITSTDIIRCFIRLQVLSRARRRHTRTERLIDLVHSGGIQLPTESIAESLFGKVSELMTKNLITLNQRQPLSQAMEIIVSHGIRHLPVVDDAAELVGMVSDRDILSYLPPPPRETAEEARDVSDGFRAKLFDVDRHDPQTVSILGMAVGEVMSRNPVSVGLETPTPEAVELLCQKQIGAVLVLANAGKQVVGIVTLTDVLEAIHAITRLSPLASTILAGKPPMTASSPGQEATERSA